MVSIIQKPVNFIREVRQELGKVAWSSRNELMGATVVVMVITAIMAVFIGLIDLVLSKILTIVFK
jgi:preprotein translocase subunit SecE